MSEVTFLSPGGLPPGEFMLLLGKEVTPTQGDALFAGQRQRTRILERTLRGVDVDGNPFEPYSRNGPYYYYPNGRVGRNKAEVKRNKAAVSRLLRRLADTADQKAQFDLDAPEASGGRRTHGGQGIRFESYADFKESLGRAGVDLRGPRAPHMLQAMAVGVGVERDTGEDRLVGLTDLREPAVQIAIGIYGEEAGRAEAHNTGYSPRWKRRHQRRFLGATEADLQEMVADIAGRCAARSQLLKG